MLHVFALLNKVQLCYTLRNKSANHLSLFLGEPPMVHVLGSSDQMQVQFPGLILTIFNYRRCCEFRTTFN